MIKKSFRMFLYLMAMLLILSQPAHALNIVQLSPEYFPNSSVGRALSSADIYVGKPDLDPEIVANQKTLSVQQEDGTIVAVSQPISTSAGGVPQYLGSPVTLLVEGDYSLKVLDSSGSQIYYVPSTAYEKYLVAGNYYYPDYSEADQGVAGGGETVADIVAEVGVVTNATMYFSHNSGAATTTYTFLTSETIPANITIFLERGAVFGITGATVTLQCPIIAEAQDLGFDENMVYSSSTIANSRWWNDDLDKAIAAMGTGDNTLEVRATATLSTAAAAPATLNFMIPQGGVVANAGNALTIAGAITAGGYDVGFDEDVVYNSPSVANVKWWGAVGDDATDNSDAFNNAIDALEAGSYGGTLFFPKGIYRIGTQVNQAAGFIAWQGEGYGSEIHSYLSASSPAVYFDNSEAVLNGVQIRDMRFIGGRLLGGSETYLIQMNYTRAGIMEGCYIGDSNGGGVKLLRGQDFVFTNNEVRGSNEWGIEHDSTAGGSGQSIRITENVIIGNGRNVATATGGIKLVTGTEAIVTHNEIANHNYHVDDSAFTLLVDRVRVTNNTFESNNNYTIGAIGNSSGDNLLINNSFSMSNKKLIDAKATVSFASVGKTITDATNGDFINDGVLDGSYVLVSGAGEIENNGPFLVASRTATVLTLDDTYDPPGNVTDEVAGETVTIYLCDVFKIIEGSGNQISNNAIRYLGQVLEIGDENNFYNHWIYNAGSGSNPNIVSSDGSFSEGKLVVTNTKDSTFRHSTIVDGDTTPNVGHGLPAYFTTNTTGATSITAFDNLYEGQRFMLWTGDANTTLVDGATLLTGTGADIVLASGDFVMIEARGTTGSGNKPKATVVGYYSVTGAIAAGAGVLSVKTGNASAGNTDGLIELFPNIWVPYIIDPTP